MPLVRTLMTSPLGFLLRERPGRRYGPKSVMIAIWRFWSAGRHVLLLARSQRQTSRIAPGELHWTDPGGRLRRLQPALCCFPQARSDYRGGVLAACAAQLLRSRPFRQGADRDRRQSKASMSCSRSSVRSGDCCRRSGSARETNVVIRLWPRCPSDRLRMKLPQLNRLFFCGEEFFQAHEIFPCSK